MSSVGFYWAQLTGIMASSYSRAQAEGVATFNPSSPRIFGFSSPLSLLTLANSFFEFIFKFSFLNEMQLITNSPHSLPIFCLKTSLHKAQINWNYFATT